MSEQEDVVKEQFFPMNPEGKVLYEQSFVRLEESGDFVLIVTGNEQFAKIHKTDVRNLSRFLDNYLFEKEVQARVDIENL